MGWLPLSWNRKYHTNLHWQCQTGSTTTSYFPACSKRNHHNCSTGQMSVIVQKPSKPLVVEQQKEEIHCRIDAFEAILHYKAYDDAVELRRLHCRCNDVLLAARRHTCLSDTSGHCAQAGRTVRTKNGQNTRHVRMAHATICGCGSTAVFSIHL